MHSHTLLILPSLSIASAWILTDPLTSGHGPEDSPLTETSISNFPCCSRTLRFAGIYHSLFALMKWWANMISLFGPAGSTLNPFHSSCVNSTFPSEFFTLLTKAADSWLLDTSWFRPVLEGFVLTFFHIKGSALPSAHERSTVS